MSKKTASGRSAPKTALKEPAISVDIDPFSKLLDLEPEKENVNENTSKTKSGRKK